LDKLPTFDDVSPFKELLFEDLDAAIIDTKQHFDVNKHRDDVPGFFAKHIRSKLHDLLEPEGPKYGFSIDTSTGSFLIAYKNFLIKLYKAYNGMPPLPSKDNRARLQFLNHNKVILPWPQRLPGFENSETVPEGARVHLLAYYDLGVKHEFAWLRIACPLSVTSTGIDCLWNKEVDNPLSDVAKQPRKGSVTERPDIKISLLSEEDNELEEENDESSGLG